MSIPDDVDLYRRIHRTHLRPDGTPSSAAFKDRSGELSCDDSRKAAPQETLEGGTSEHVGVAQFFAGSARALGLEVRPASDILFLPAHVLVVGDFKRKIARRLRDAALERGWALAPSDVA